MKKILLLPFLSALFLVSLSACAQSDKSKRPSPPAKVSETISSGAVVSIDYSQPALKGRTIGKDVEPKKGEVWRAGANEATVFECNKDIMVEGKKLAAGKYGLFMIDNGNDWTIIFNKTWNQWGSGSYKSADDALRVNVTPGKSAAAMERLTYTIEKSGKVSLNWGTLAVSFTVQ